MATETILQHWIFSSFVFPFLLIFFITFGILQKSKLFGDKSQQLNAFISFVIGLIFVGAVYPKLLVGNLILFLTVAIVIMFVALMLWGFVAGEEGLKFANIPKEVKGIILFVIVASVVIAVVWMTGVQGTLFDFLFRQNWSNEFWTNFAFVAVVIVALASVLRKQS